MPVDVFSVTGDGAVAVYWSPPRDADVAGYRVLVSRDDADYYRVAGTPAWQHDCIVRGVSLTAVRLYLDWAHQIQPDCRELKPHAGSAANGSGTAAPGAGVPPRAGRRRNER